MPAVGDWVAVCDAPGGRRDRALLLPADEGLAQDAWLKAEEHILVANVDTVLLVSGLDGDFNPRRLERYLIAAWDSGADPVIVLTKLDVCDDFEKLAEAEAVAIGVPVLAVSATSRGGDRGGAGAPPAGRTFVLLGSSGTGKSTLVNRLAGRTLMPTGDLRNDGRGRTRRGIGSSSSSPAARSSSTRPACASSRSGKATSTARSRTSPSSPPQCRFNDCGHTRSRTARCRRRSRPASSMPDRWANYRKLQRELRAIEPGAARGFGASSSAAGGSELTRPAAPAAMGEA